MVAPASLSHSPLASTSLTYPQLATDTSGGAKALVICNLPGIDRPDLRPDFRPIPLALHRHLWSAIRDRQHQCFGFSHAARQCARGPAQQLAHFRDGCLHELRGRGARSLRTVAPTSQQLGDTIARIGCI